ncbi:MAG: ABC transporter permease [Anaerolineae bacterium]|jgi:ABC-2 type transport system permease protein
MNALSVAFKDLSLLLKDRGQILLLFLVPVGFILAFSAAFSAGEALEEEVITVPVVNLDPGGEMSALLLQNLNDERGLQTQDYDQAQAETDLKDETIKMALTIPANFSADVQAGTQTKLRLKYGPGASNSEVKAVQLVVDGVAADLSLETQLVSGLSQMGAMMGDAPREAQILTAERIKDQARSQFERAKTAPLVSLSARWPTQTTKGREDFSPSTFSVAGFAVMFAFLTAQTTAMSIFAEKREGTFRRLLAAPLSKWELVAGKMLPNFVIAIVQMVVIVAASMVLLPLVGQEAPTLDAPPLGLILIAVLVALCSTSLGILLAALSRTESQVGGISSVVLWVAGMVGGAFIPAFVLGDLLNTIGKVVPHYWALQAFNDLMLRGQGVADILPELGILAGFVVVFFAIGLTRFKFD